MAGILSSRSRAEIHVLNDPTSIRHIERSYNCIQVKVLFQQTDFSRVCLKGKVTSVKHNYREKYGWTMKISLTDLDNNSCNGDGNNGSDAVSISFKEDFPEEFKKIKENDILFIAGIQGNWVKNSTEQESARIVINERHQNLKVWILRNLRKTLNTYCGEEFVNENEYDQNKVAKLMISSGSPLPVTMLSECASPTNKTCVSLRQQNQPIKKRPPLLLEPVVRTYTKLSDLQHNTTANVYGVVKFFKSPFKTRGSDFVCTLSLVDTSLDSMEQSLKCVLFSKSKENLPIVKSVGDIVRFHHLGIGKFKEELQGKLLPGTSWLVFDREGQDTSDQESFCKSSTLTDLDKGIIAELRSWSLEQISLNVTQDLTSLKDLSLSKAFVNLLCQVISKHFTLRHDGVVLAIWDGTFPSCQSVQVEPISTEGWFAQEPLISKATGRTVDVLLCDNHAADASRVRPGDFVYIKNVHIKAMEKDSTLPKKVSLVLHRGTICGRGVEVLPPNDPFVTSSATFKHISEAKEAEVERQSINVAGGENEGPMNSTIQGRSSRDGDTSDDPKQISTSGGLRAVQTSCTITEHPLIPFSSISDIKICSVPAKFRCRVKAVMFLPSNARHFVRKCCHSCRILLPVTSGSESLSDGSQRDSIKLCPNCNQEATPVYLFSLLLEDRSGLLQAMIFDKDVTTFFPALPAPKNFVRQPDVQEIVRGMLVFMTQNPDNMVDYFGNFTTCDSRPWMELCILSYFSSEQEKSGKVLYRIFDSVFATEIASYCDKRRASWNCRDLSS